jgi:hypothetical protein
MTSIRRGSDAILAAAFGFPLPVNCCPRAATAGLAATYLEPSAASLIVIDLTAGESPSRS